jgi:integrase
MGARHWRLRKYNKAKGAWYALETGREETRISKGLGYLSEEQAATCEEAMNREEGRAGHNRIEIMFDQDRDAAIRYLLGDPGVRELLGPPAVDYGVMRVADYFEREYKPWREKAKPKSWRVEDAFWRRLLEPNGIGELRLNQLDEHSVDAYLEERLRKVDGSPATWNMKRQLRNAIAALLTYARRKRHYTRPMPAWFRLSGSTERTLPEAEPLTMAEVEKLLDGVKGHGPTERTKLRALFAVAFCEGLRPSEAVSLHWPDVDWERAHANGTGAVSVLRSTPDGGVTKTKLSRATIPLFPIARRELEAWWIASGRPTEGIVFPARAGKPYVVEGNRGTFKTALHTAAKRAGFDGRRIFPYLGRHSAGTNLVEQGAPIDTVAKVLRHSNPAMLRKHYDHTGALRAPGLAPAFDAPVAAAAAPAESLTDEAASWLDLVG